MRIRSVYVLFAILLSSLSCARFHAQGGYIEYCIGNVTLCPFLSSASSAGSATLPPAGSYLVGGTLSGWSGAGSLILQNNGADNLTINANGSFTFATPVLNGTSYSVTILSYTTGQTCTVTNATGTISGANVTNVSVTCTLPARLADGPAMTNLFGGVGGTVTAGQFFIYNGKLQIGPNVPETEIYETTFDLLTQSAITIDGDGVAGAPYASFIGLPNASGTNLAGIDFFYAACTGASPATLTGTACTAAGGTEHSFIGGYITSGGSYKSIWDTTDLGSIRTYTQISGFETGPQCLRSMSMSVFKDQLYVALQDKGGGAAKLSRSCVKVGGCANGNAFHAITLLNGKNLNHIGKAGTFSNGAAGLASIDSMWEYDNDGTGSNPSQLYIAGGGSTGGTALPSTAGQTRDGGILRSKLTYSTSASTPGTCSFASTCDGYWEDVTPTNAKWLAYMSIALPSDPTTGQDWDALVPANRITPAIKAIPAMRTAPNGDLYLIRNGCSDITVHTVALGNFLSNGSQTCLLGSEIPQLWMLPKGTTLSPKGAGDWVLVAEAGATGRTDMSGNASCTPSGTNYCDTENTHITLLEFNGSFLYIGYDNPTYGLNVWRTDMSTVASGATPLESSFSLVGGFGVGDSVNNTRIFSSATVNASGTNYLFLLTGNGSNAVRIFRTNNN